MKNFIRVLAIVLLYLVGISAIIGGWGLISDPSGNAVDLPLTLLQHTPFTNFFYPGLILILAIGLGSLMVGSLAILKAKYYDVLIVAEGFILLGWIIIQVALIDVIYWLHFIYGGMGILLIVAGILLYEWQHHEKTPRKHQFA